MNSNTKAMKNRIERVMDVKFYVHHTPGAPGSEVTTPTADGRGERRVTYGSAQKLEGFFEGLLWAFDELAYSNPEILAARLADVAPEAILAAAKEVKKKNKK